MWGGTKTCHIVDSCARTKFEDAKTTKAVLEAIKWMENLVLLFTSLVHIKIINILMIFKNSHPVIACKLIIICYTYIYIYLYFI